MMSSSDELVSFLRDRDVPCPSCGYSLRGMESDRCPECGAAVRLELARADSGAGFSWLAAVAGFGLSAVLAAYFVYEALRPLDLADSNPDLRALIARGFATPPGTPNWRNVMVTVAAMMLVLLAATWVLAMRSRWTRLPLPLRLGAAVLAAASPFALLGALAGIIGFVL